MKVSIFLLCHNEEVLLPKTIEHYRRYLPNSNFTLYDNMSTDDSVKIAKELGCNVFSFDTNEQMDDFKMMKIKNKCWGACDGWTIVCDMDEWLCIDEKWLNIEDSEGATIIETQGYQIIADSKHADLRDIDLHKQHMGFACEAHSKKICFKANEVEINYTLGGHLCVPTGNVQFGGSYLLKHMDWLGLAFKLEKNKKRFERSEKMRKIGIGTHYIKNENQIISMFESHKRKREDLRGLCECFQ
jgi:glycosyltransferase involved in cell wall biosynthesis